MDINKGKATLKKHLTGVAIEGYSCHNEIRPPEGLRGDQEIEESDEEWLMDLRENDRKVALFLKQNGNGCCCSFNGLARRLSIHQQSLARSLRRLVELGIVSSSNDGYKLIPSNTVQINNESQHQKISIAQNKEHYFQLVQAHFPLSGHDEAIIHQLTGRRFGTLRWLGIINSKDECCLQWINEGGSLLVVVHMISCYLVIETNALTKTERIEALKDSYKIFAKIVTILYKESIGLLY